MHTSRIIVIGTILATNLVGVFLMGFDKRRARIGGKRIREDLLLLIACLGGSPGIYTGMRVFRHKTRKLLFRVAIPLLLLLQGIAMWMQLWPH